MAIPVDNVATEGDLADEIGGATLLNRAKVAGQVDFTTARQLGLNDVLEHLAARTPPIREADLSVVSELKRAVVYRALERICRNAITADGDAWSVRARTYHTEYEGAIARLKPTVNGSSTGSPTGFSYSRR